MRILFRSFGISLVILGFICLSLIANDIPNDKITENQQKTPVVNKDETAVEKTIDVHLLNSQPDATNSEPKISATTTQKYQAKVEDFPLNNGEIKINPKNEDANVEPMHVIKDSFDPYTDDDDDIKIDEHEGHEDIPLDRYDFDPSEGLSFLVKGKTGECFYEEIKHLGDKLEGAYIVLAEEPEISFSVISPGGQTLYHRDADAEGEYLVRPKEIGVFQLCFANRDSENKMITHVTHTLQSQHPVEKEHVDVLSKYVSHIDIRLGELESEQRLLQLRTDRHLKIQEKMNLNVSFYAVLICIFYVLVCWLQNYYIQRMLENPYRAIPTISQPTPRRWA